MISNCSAGGGLRSPERPPGGYAPRLPVGLCLVEPSAVPLTLAPALLTSDIVFKLRGMRRLKSRNDCLATSFLRDEISPRRNVRRQKVRTCFLKRTKWPEIPLWSMKTLSCAIRQINRCKKFPETSLSKLSFYTRVKANQAGLLSVSPNLATTKKCLLG